MLKSVLRSSILKPPPECDFPVKTAEANSSLCSCKALILSSTVFEHINLKRIKKSLEPQQQQLFQKELTYKY